MRNDIDAATIWPASRAVGVRVDVDGKREDRAADRTADRVDTDAACGDGIWQNTIAAADHALEEANRIQRGVQQNLKLMQEMRNLREELRKAHAEVDRYRGMHARVVVSMRQIEEERDAELARLQADNEMLLVRHRVYKLLAEHYATAALGFDAKVFTEHRDRVLEHVLFQRRKGTPVTRITRADISFLLL
ncbi:hypothetical protein [Cupriavidus pampae]|uniref:Uncharacterized protein n=1 Tax=Cupriavidus pampae TaxID=659251 RepID=A0ABN7YSB7_9BURK|nr:hypothetical protein [Cupriavidus pampae]CAG9176374.1 hypothetical protein LMG32289_03511 [Cupriavidus pampae]